MEVCQPIFSAQATAAAKEAITESLRSHCQNHCLINLELKRLEGNSDSVIPNLKYQRKEKKTETHICTWKLAANVHPLGWRYGGFRITESLFPIFPLKINDLKQ
jgi:hypothetical protein